jgi:protein-S-isoprenylcysteine O-methyltransferase Ste14
MKLLQVVVTADLADRFIFICWAICIIYWLVSAFSVKRTVEGRGVLWHLVILADVLVVAVLFRGGTPLPLPLRVRLWPYTPTIGVISDLIVLAGLIVMLWARAVLGGNWSAGVVLKEDHEIVDRGPYRYVRHPIYSGLLLMLLGMAILQGRAVGLAVVALFLIGFRFKAYQEERLLTRHFPAAYPIYRARVKGLIPFVW